MSFDDEIMRIKEVEQDVGLSRSTIYNERRKGTFPDPVQITDHSIGWFRGDIKRWKETRPKRSLCGGCAK